MRRSRESRVMSDESKNTTKILVGFIVAGIIALFVLQNYRIEQLKKRDAQRKSDLAKIQQTLSDYYIKNHHYPLSVELPPDPYKQLYYVYQVSKDGKKYELFARLENIKDPNMVGGLDAECGAQCNYVVTNP